MTEQTVWTVLGIPAGSDRSAIRKAYAKKLRAVNPEDDPEGFKALREAFEIALHYAELPPFEEEPNDEAEPAWTVVETSPAAPAPPEERVPLAEGAAEPEADPEAHPDRADEEGLRLEFLLNRFAALLDEPEGADIGALEAILDEVVASPALDEIGLQQRVERWMAFHIARSIPRSDLLIDRAVAAFGWGGSEIVRDGAVEAILRRVDEWRYIDWAEYRESPVNLGWLALTKPPRSERGMRLSALSAARANQVDQILRTAAAEMPGLYHQFQPDALAWWQTHLAQARVTIGVLALMPAVALLTALAASLIDSRAWPALIPVGGLLSLASPWLYLRFVKQPQLDWQNWRRPVPAAWFSEGWMAALALLPLAAALLPAGPVGGAVSLLLSALVAAWTAAAVPPPYPLIHVGTRLPLLVRRLALPTAGALGMAAALHHGFVLAALSVGAAFIFAWWRGSEEMTDGWSRLCGYWSGWVAATVAVALAGAVILARDHLPQPTILYLAALAVILGALILLAAWRSTQENGRFVVALGWVALFFMYLAAMEPLPAPMTPEPGMEVAPPAVGDRAVPMPVFDEVAPGPGGTVTVTEPEEQGNPAPGSAEAVERVRRAFRDLPPPRPGLPVTPEQRRQEELRDAVGRMDPDGVAPPRDSPSRD